MEHFHQQLPARDGEEEAIADRLYQPLLEEDALGQEVVVVERKSPVVIDYECWPFFRNVFEAVHFVSVPDPAVCIPHHGDRSARPVPQVTLIDGFHYRLQAVPVPVKVHDAGRHVEEEDDDGRQEERQLVSDEKTSALERGNKRQRHAYDDWS